MRQILKIAAGLLLLCLLLFYVDLTEFLRLVEQANLVYVALSVALSFAMVAASTWKWWVLLRVYHPGARFSLLFKIYFVGYFYTNFLPSNVGGDVARVLLAGRHYGRGDVAASVFGERVTGLLLLLLMVVISPAFMPALYGVPAILAGVLAVGGGLMVLLVLAASVVGRRVVGLRIPQWESTNARYALLIAWINKTAGKLNLVMDKSVQLWGALQGRPLVMLQVLGLTVLFYLLMITNMLLCFRVFADWPSAAPIAAVFPLAQLFAMVPLTFGNLGITEGAYVYFYSLLGLSPTLILAVGLFLRAKLIFLGIVGFFVHLSLGKSDAVGA